MELVRLAKYRYGWWEGNGDIQPWQSRNRQPGEQRDNHTHTHEFSRNPVTRLVSTAVMLQLQRDVCVPSRKAIKKNKTQTRIAGTCGSGRNGKSTVEDLKQRPRF